MNIRPKELKITLIVKGQGGRQKTKLSEKRFVKKKITSRKQGRSPNWKKKFKVNKVPLGPRTQGLTKQNLHYSKNRQEGGVNEAQVQLIRLIKGNQYKWDQSKGQQTGSTETTGNSLCPKSHTYISIHLNAVH